MRFLAIGPDRDRERIARMEARVAAAAYITLGLGFGIGAAVTQTHLRRTGELPMTPWGFRAFSGPLEALPPEQFAGLLSAVTAVCALDVVAGLWLWEGRERGAQLGLATTPFAVLLGVGFALPLLLVGIPIRTALLLAGRRTLR